MMNRYFNIGLLLLAFQFGCAQTTRIPDSIATTKPKSNHDFNFTSFIPGNFRSLEVDALGNIYLLTNNFQLKKLDQNGDSIAVFNDVKRFGNPGYVDVSNPFKTLVYYRNYTTIVVLDRFLSARNTINLRKENIFKVKAVTTSYDNHIWIFDEQDFKLKKITDEGKLIFESNDLRQLVDVVPSPEFITDTEGSIYLYDPKKGFIIFDQYGAIKNQLPFTNWSDPSVGSMGIFGFGDNKLYRYTPESLTLKEYPLPEFFSKYSSIRTLNGKVYLLKSGGIEIYNIL